MRKRLATVLGLALAGIAGAAGAQTQPHTLQEALAAAYNSNPTLLAARAALRAIDEQVPQALAGWRPTIIVSGSYGGGAGTLQQSAAKIQSARESLSASATITQPIYTGGRTEAQTHQAENRVMSQRGRLIATEQLVFTNVINDYVNVIQAEQLLQLDINNEQVLNRQLQATNDRFRVGEITRTDVAQAEAAAAGARATRQTAEGSVQTARAAFQRDVGFLPSNLVVPQPLSVPVKNAADASRIAGANNPTLIYTMFDAAASKDAVDIAFSAIMPTLNVQASTFRQDNTTFNNSRSVGAQALLNLSVPIYQGGAEYAAVRAARQTEQQSRKTVDDTRRQVIQAALIVLGNAGGCAQHYREQPRRHPCQPDRPGRHATRSDRRQPDHARRAECGASVAAIPCDPGAEPGQPGDLLLRRGCGAGPADRARPEPERAAV